ncbi:hypothetical protein [Epilithonimonas sp. UC225_85]|uniref:hypothetical protein n=1 Tax=Epilithonimonas sp. UC225_85 TaxID=3350167 RepID=UPI0036D43654
MFKKLKALLSYRNLLIANFFIVIFKIIYIAIIQKEFLANEDFTIAENIVKYHQYSEIISLGGTAFKLPAYPFCIAFFIWIAGKKALLTLAIFQSLLSFFTPVFLYKILKLFKFEKTGILAGFLFIFSPAYFLYSGSIEATNIFIPVLLLWFYLYFKIWFSTDNKSGDFISLGVVTSALFLIQVVTVPLSCIMILSMLLFKKVNFRNFSFLVFTVVILYSPWVIRNYYVFDQLVLSKTPAWQNIYFGFTQNGQLSDDLKLIPKDRDYYIYSLRYKVSELTMEKIYKQEVIKVTNLKPEIFIKKAAINLLCLWYVPPKYFDNDSLSVLLGRKIYVIFLDIFTLISLVILYKRSKILFCFSVLFFANFSFPYMIGHAANMRFKLDFEWYQLILTAYLFLVIFQKFRKTENLVSL